MELHTITDDNIATGNELQWSLAEKKKKETRKYYKYTKKEVH